jgi:hypothetical protein
MSLFSPLAALLTLAIAAVTAQAETRFTIVDSSPSSWVARGYDNYTVTPATPWTFTPTRNFDNGVSFNISGTPLPGTAVDYWRVEMAAPGNALLVPGVYANFQRFPFQDAERPGLAFASTGRLDNMAAGTFQVLEATYGPGGEVLTFAVNFTHYGETNVNNYAIVELRYNSVPAPASLFAVAAVAVVTGRRRRV